MNIRKYIFTLTSFAFLLNDNTMLAMERVQSCKNLYSHFDCSNVEFDEEYCEISSLVPEQDKDSSEDVNKVKELLNELPYLQERDLKYDECRDGYINNNADTLNGIKTILEDSSFDDSICSTIVENIVERFGFSGVFNEMLFDMLPYGCKMEFILTLFKNPYSLSSKIHYWQKNIIKRFQCSTLKYVERYEDFQGMINQEIVNKLIIYKEFDESLFNILPKNVKQESIIRIVSRIDKNTTNNMTRKGAITIFESLITSKYMNQRAYTGIEGLLRELKNVNNNELNKKELEWINDTLNYVNEIFRIKVIHKN